jgi:glucose-1-phosphate cytidylyltransferase
VDQTAKDGKWAVLLCGGSGSRMGDLTRDKPKPLLEVHGHPILWYAFMTLYQHGFRNFVFPLGYKGDMIRKFITEISQDMPVSIQCIDTGEDTSIAHRIHQVKDAIPDHQDFFILNSDTIFDFDIQAMHQVHQETKALVTLSSVVVISAWGLIMMNGNNIVGFDRQRKVRYLESSEIPGVHGAVNSGLAWLNKDALLHIDLLTCGDFETDLYQKLIAMNRAAHFEITGDWFPIDTPKDLHAINFKGEDKHDTWLSAKAMKDTINNTKVQNQEDDK